ncbi:MAG: hypothetical protein DHS20C15_21740 [Planctomycetota bacterium]|nr:MAG: hypothetical protein DHS20C15_21740 [Planctomycetota bacterium]
MSPHSKLSRATLTPDAVLQLLRDGNERFVSGNPVARAHDADIAATSGGQFPLAIVLGCIDSRVPVELLLDVGVGDVFSARVAGNVVNNDMLGSVEFACKVAGAKLIVVLGHSRCGAVMGACDGVELGHLTSLLGRIRPAAEAVRERLGRPEADSTDAEFVQAVALENVSRSIAELRARSAVIKEQLDAGEIRAVGAVYDVSSGRVTFLD